MQSKLTIKTLIESSLVGNFKNVYKIVASKQIDVETNSAIKIIVAICNACHKNLSTPEVIDERDLILLLKCLTDLIKVPSSDNFEHYAQSAFYILKLLIEKKNYDLVLELENFFMPEFMPLILTEKHCSIYQSICKSLYNIVVRSTQSRDKQSLDKILKLSYFLTSLYKKLDKIVSLHESAHNCILGLVTLNVTSSEVVSFYQHVLSLLDRVEDVSLYSLLINNFSFMYTHLLKSGDYILATECYKMTTDHLKPLFKGKDHGLLWEILEIIQWLNPGSQDQFDQPKKSHDSLKNYHRIYNSTRNLQSVCDSISSVASTVLQISKKTDDWIQLSDHHVYYYNFLNDIALIMAKSPYVCKNCRTETNLNEALRALNTIGGLGRLYLTKKIDAPRNYKLEILRYLEKFVNYVFALKENGCEKWKKHWYDVGVHLYSIGVQLYQNKDTEGSVSYLQKFVQTLLEFEGPSPELIDKTYLNSALNCVADTYFENECYEKCLSITSLGIILNEKRKNEINRWIKAKAALREKTIEENRELQELTLVSVCDKFRRNLSAFLPKSGLKLDDDTKFELLYYELRQYSLKWKSKIPMSAVFRELSHIASPRRAGEIFIEIWGDGDMLVHETLPKILQEIIRRIEIETIPKKDILLAHLYFLQHRYRVKDTIVKHCDEMEKTMNLTRVNNEVINGIVPPDPDDECDLVSSYECLKLSRYLNMTKELNTSLDLLHIWLSKNPPENDRERLFKLLSNIGHEFGLHNHSTRSLEAWELALKISRNEIEKLQATGFIIELGDVRKPLLQTMIKEAEKGIPFLKTNKNFEELITYHICKAEAYFHLNFEKSQKAFREASDLSEEFSIPKILKARLFLLEHKFIMLPCKYQIESHQQYSLVRIHQANNTANSYYNENSSISSYDMRIFFEIYETLAKMYHDLCLPREVRCYARDSVVIAQKMVLPLRTSALLYYLAYADINTCRLDDSRVKIKDFSDILGISTTTNQSNSPYRLSSKVKKDLVEDLVGDFKEMVLDIPTRRRRSTSNGSPSFSAETFRIPPFLSHDKNCDCFYCTCIEYQKFVLKKIYLEALLHTHENNIRLAQDFFYGCFKIFELLRSKEIAYVKKVSKTISIDLIPVLSEQFVELYCLAKIEYGNTLIREELLGEAKNVNLEALCHLEKYNSKFIYLYNEALAQKLDIIVRSLSVRQPPIQIKISNVKSDVNIKTPPSKKSEILLSPVHNTEPVEETSKIVPKSLKFDLSDNEEDTEETSKRKQPKNLPPFLGVKTPAPSSSKIKIYTQKTKKTTRSNVLIEIPSFKEGDFSTPSSVDKGKLPQQLASRTKLLTDRLKNSTRKASVTDENVERVAVKSNVRQNLLKQLSGSDNVERSENIRRSARNKK